MRFTMTILYYTGLYRFIQQNNLKTACYVLILCSHLKYTSSVFERESCVKCQGDYKMRVTLGFAIF
jgi:hypothetical protein